MNERINELIKKCTSVYDDLVYDGRDTYMKTTEYFDKTKFAELIVEECRTVVNDLYHKTPLELCGPLLTADEEIAKHFYGVEE